MDTSLEDAERTPLMRRHQNKSLRQVCFMWRAYIDLHPVLLKATEVSLGVLAFVHVAASLLLALSAMFRIPFSSNALSRSVTLLPLVLLCLEVAVLCCVLVVIIYADFSKRRCASYRVRGVTVWQREAVGRIVRNLVVSALLGLTTWQLYTHIIFKDAGIKMKGSLLSIFLPTCLLCTLSVLKVALIRTADGLYWLATSLAFLLCQGLMICKADYSATFSWSAILLPLYAFLAVSAFQAFYALYQAIFPADKDPKFTQVPQAVLTLIAIFLTAATLSHLQKAIAGESTPSEVAWYVLMAFPAVASALCVPVGQVLLDIVWGHVEMDFIHSKNPVGLARSRSV